MKFKFLILILGFVLLSVDSFGQEDKKQQPLSIFISLKESTSPIHSKNAPIKVEITNNSNTFIDTKYLGLFTFNFSHQLESEKVSSEDESYSAFFNVKSKLLKQGESFEFQINLANLAWSENLESSSFYILSDLGWIEKFSVLSDSRPAYKPFFSGVYFLSAIISQCEKSTIHKDSLLKSNYKSCKSNVLLVKVNSLISK